MSKERYLFKGVPTISWFPEVICRVSQRIAFGWRRLYYRQKKEIEFMRAENGRLREARGRCKWTENENGSFDTDCGNTFEFNYDGPTKNGCKFCCYCGKELVEFTPIEPAALRDGKQEP